MDNSAFTLGQWKIEPAINRISQADQQVILVPKVMRLLLVLVQHQGEALSLEALLKEVWQGQVVSDSSVYQAIAQLRKALGDKASQASYIQRVSGKGYRLIAEVTPIEQVEKPIPIASTRKTYGVVAAFCMLLMSVLLFIYWSSAKPVVPLKQVKQAEQVKQAPPLRIDQINSISLVRLTNENLGEAKKLDGLNDVLLTQLMQIQGMRLVSLPSLNAIAQGLTTQALIQGRISQQGNTVLVFLQLSQSDSNEVIWAKQFSGDIKHVFTLQDSIVDNLLELFKRKQNQRGFAQAQINNRNFDQYLLARHLWQQRKGPALYQAKAIFEEMQQQQALFPLAAVGLCNTYHYLHIYADWSLKQALSKCQPLLQQALEQQPELGQAIAAQAMLLSSQGKLVAAQSLFKQAIKRAPNYAFAYMWYADLIRRLAKYQQSLVMIKKAYALAPMSPIINRSLAYAYLNSGDRQQARYYYARALVLEPEYSDRALQELDFLPISISRAKSFLWWAKQHPSIMRKHPDYRLTRAQIELALGDYNAVSDTLAQLQHKTINPSFMLFIQTSLAAAQGRYQALIGYLKQRMEIHQDKARFSDAYLSVLYQMGDYEQAYKTFLQLRPELSSSDIAVNQDNRYQLIYYVRLQYQRNNMHLVAALAEKIERSFATIPAKDNIYYAQWLVLRGQKEQAKAMILSLMHNGWLPDYDADLFPEAIMVQLFINTALGQQAFDHLLSINRDQVKHHQ